MKTYYAPAKIMSWDSIKVVFAGERLSLPDLFSMKQNHVGFLPVYEDEAACRADYPNCKIVTMSEAPQ